MNPILQTTADKSDTLLNPELNQTYHSVHGAVQESEHVYIKNGLLKINLPEITIFEMGFGTGLNALLTFKHAQQQNFKIHYICVEKYPVSISIAAQLNYCNIFSELSMTYNLFHNCLWDTQIIVSDNFTFTKHHTDISSYVHIKQYHLVYYDAFSPDAQPELWSTDIFKLLYNAMHPDGIFTTYTTKGIVKQNLRTCGFIVKRLKGPPGKHQMLNAFKNPRI